MIPIQFLRLSAVLVIGSQMLSPSWAQSSDAAASRYPAAVGMAVAAVIIGVSDNIARPWVQSARGGLHPLLVLVSIFGGLQTLGPAGVFLGPVIAAMALWAIDTYAALREKQEQRAEATSS